MSNRKMCSRIIRVLGPAVFLALISCGPARDVSPSLFRIVDLLSPEHILETPFENLHLKFHSVEEDLSGQWTYLPELSSRVQQTFAYSTGFPVLGDPDIYESKETELLHDGRPVAYLQAGSSQEKNWRWLQTNESLEMSAYPQYDRSFRGARIDHEHPMEFSKIMPEGETLVEFVFVVPELDRYQPTLIVMVDGETIEEFLISRRRWYRIRHHVKQGERTFQIKMKPRPGGAADEFAIVGRVDIESASDLLLLSQPYRPGSTPPEGRFSFRYHSYDSLVSGENQDRLESAMYLYYLRRKDPLQDAGVIADTLGVKKKLNFDDFSLNALVAPPKSHYAVPVTVPKGASLDFEFGIVNDDRQAQSEREIRFSIFFESGKDRKVLFEETASLQTHPELVTRRIDLSELSGKKGRLNLLTEEIPSDNEAQDKNYPVWVNPVVSAVPSGEDVNIILISLDTLRPDYLGCYGYERETSPAMDAFARDAVLFENTYSTSSWTLPAHVSMLTALNCVTHQIYFPLEKMGREVDTMANLLRTGGFFCSGFSGGGYLSSTYGFAKGFDSYQEIRLRGDRAIRFDESERLADAARDWLEFNRDRRFFLFLHTYQPHDPYINLSPLGKMFLEENSQWDQVRMDEAFEGKGRFGKQFTPEQRRNIQALYEGEIRYTDDSLVKPVLEKLKQLGLYDRTLVIITSDHGEEFYDHESWLHDHSLYQEGIKIPLMIKFPNSTNSGLRISDTARIIDILPTVLDGIDMDVPENALDGASLIPLINGEKEEPRSYISDLALRQYEEAPTVIASNQGNLKLIINDKTVSPYVKKVGVNFEDTVVELYDVEADPGEKRNLAQEPQYRSTISEILRRVRTVYIEAEKRKKSKEKATIDSTLEERLRALGYIKTP